MKYFISIAIILTSFIVQSQNLHSAKVMGIIPIGQKDVAIINDLITGEFFKTTIYNQELLVANENIELNFFDPEDNNKAKIVKQNLSKAIFCFKENSSNPCNNNSICIEYYGDNMIVIQYTEDNLQIVYEARITGAIINSSVRIFEEVSIGVSEIISTTTFLIDTEIENYKLSLHHDINEKATNLRNTLSETKWNSIATVYENFLIKLNIQKSTDFHTDLGLSTAFHLAIYKTIEKSLSESEDCDCLPSPLYFDGRTPFMCIKDLIFNVDKMLEIYTENETEINIKYDEATVSFFLNYLNQQQKANFTFDEMYFSTFGNREEYNSALDGEIGCMGGSDLGCCGNYSGCCWYASLSCLSHDIACWSCDGWYCLWDCNPE